MRLHIRSPELLFPLQALDAHMGILSLAHETLSSGADIFVAGTVFMSDFEVKAEEDTVKPFLNKTILENILRDSQVALPVTDIADMRKGQMGEIFTIEGYVTAGTATKGNPRNWACLVRNFHSHPCSQSTSWSQIQSLTPLPF